MKKVLQLFIVTMLCLLGGANELWAQTTVTFTAGTDKGTYDNASTGADQVVKDGITIQTTSGNSAFAAAQYRFSKGSVTTFTSTVGNITKVEFTCTASGTTKYGPGCFENPSVGSYDYKGKVGTWTGNAASFTLTAGSNQVRATTIVFTIAASSGKKTADLSYATTTYTVTLGEPFTAPTLANPNNLSPITYASDKPEIAAVNASTGAVTLGSTAGVAKITASFAGNDAYEAGEASYTIKLQRQLDLIGDGTEANPYTVADVNLLFENNQVPEEEVCVKGIVSEVGAFNSTYGQINYYISDDGTAAGQFYIYGGLGLDGEKFTAVSDLNAGDRVVVKGQLVTFNSTNEMNYGNKIISISSSGKEDAALSYETASYDVTLGSAFTAPALTNPNNLSPITYASSNTEVATVDASTGAVAIVAAGTATITASFAGNDTYKADEASYTINVVDPNNTTETATYIFNTEEGVKALGISVPAKSQATDLEEGHAYNSGVVTMTVTHGGTNTRIYNSNGNLDLRLYKNGGSITISVPADYTLKEIDFDGGFTDWTATEEYVTSVTFSATDTKKVKAITVTYAKATTQAQTLSDAVEANTLTAALSNVTLTRSFNAGVWNSLVLPFSLTADQAKDVLGENVRIANFTGTTETDGTMTLHFTETTDGIEANVPVFVYGAQDVSGKVVENVVVSVADPAVTPSDSKVSFVGTYSRTTAQAGDWFVSADNKMYCSVNGGNSIKPMRAVFRPTDANSAKSLVLDINGETTAIDAISGESKADADAPLYNLAGQRVSKSYKGVVVKNGRKFINK